MFLSTIRKLSTLHKKLVAGKLVNPLQRLSSKRCYENWKLELTSKLLVFSRLYSSPSEPSFRTNLESLPSTSRLITRPTETGYGPFDALSINDALEPPFRREHSTQLFFYFTFFVFPHHTLHVCTFSIAIEHLPSRYGQSVYALVYATVLIREAHMADPNPSKWLLAKKERKKPPVFFSLIHTALSK